MSYPQHDTKFPSLNMPRTYETKLPAPGVDIIRTPHVRTFVPGSGGQHMDTILQNQLTIIRQNQDVRTQLALLLDDQERVSKVTGPEKAGEVSVVKLIMSEGLINAAVRSSRAYHGRHGDGTLKLRRTKTLAYTIKKWRAALMDDPRLSKSQKLELDGLQEHHVQDLHLYCAAEVRGKMEGEAKRSNGYGKKGYGDVKKDSVSDETEYEIEYDSGYGEEERRAKKRRRVG